MPIFQDDLENQGHDDSSRPPSARARPMQRPSSISRRLSDESFPTELGKGPVPAGSIRPCTPKADDDVATSCRAELIQRLKRGESPTWIPNRHLESILQVFDNSSGRRTPPESTQLLPSVQITPEKAGNGRQNSVDDQFRHGLEIERPKSAFHRGDFTNSQQDQGRPLIHDRERLKGRLGSESPWIATTTTTTTTTTTPPRDFAPFRFERNAPFPGDTESFRSVTSSPPSASFSSSFAYYPPTSPLVQSESNDEGDFALGRHGLDASSSRELHHRLQAINSMASTSFSSPLPRPAAGSFRFPSRREPYQAHQPRRSLTSTPNLALPRASSHQTPAMLRPRRPSLGSDSSPMQHASMVGSYEESILRGRMSTSPSKPFDFLAQIGVLGKGKCKSSLLCPAHVTLPFHAVYYNYSSTSHSRSASNDGPSPYVGQIDLENGLPDLEEESRLRRRAHGRYLERKAVDDQGDICMPDVDLDDDDSDDDRARPRSRPKRRVGSPRAPPGGSYRIPEKGQIQIIIKNQNKTAVKLFLMPYDLTAMEPGTKTFIRQRSYSAGPVTDNDAPNASETDAQSRPMLRYLVHLHICCTSKGRFYLYKSIRVVFANRVPAGDEKLRNETTWPEPRFAPYKPIRLMHPPLTSSPGPGAMLAVDKAFRRRSLGISFGAASSRAAAFGMVDGHDSPGAGAGNTLPLEAIPFRLPRRDLLPRDSDGSDFRSPESSQTTSRPSTKGSASMAVGGGGTASSSAYEKLNKGDFGYGGNAFFAHAPASEGLGATEGLLSRRLRSLHVGGGKQPPPPPQSAEDLA